MDRTDAIITRWLTRHLQRLGAGVELEQLEGRLEGERRFLQRQLTRRFGELPTWVEQQLENASAETLDTWADEILTAGSLEELFGR